MKPIFGHRNERRFTRIVALIIAGFLVIGVIVAALFPLVAGAEETPLLKISVDGQRG